MAWWTPPLDPSVRSGRWASSSSLHSGYFTLAFVLSVLAPPRHCTTCVRHHLMRGSQHLRPACLEDGRPKRGQAGVTGRRRTEECIEFLY
jgi:hypothetical protein